MANAEEIIEITLLYEKSFGCTLPKAVRQKIEVNSSEHTLVFIREPDGEISLTRSGQVITGDIIATADFSRDVFQFTFPKKIRQILKLKKGGKIAYWERDNEKILIRNASK